MGKLTILTAIFNSYVTFMDDGEQNSLHAVVNTFQSPAIESINSCDLWAWRTKGVSQHIPKFFGLIKLGNGQSMTIPYTWRHERLSLQTIYKFWIST